MKTITTRTGQAITVDDDVYLWASAISWTIDSSGYTHYARCSEGRLHRMILKATPGQIVDHINGDGLDNRRENLRLCSVAENNRNTTKRLGSYTSKYKGVSWNKRLSKFYAQIKKDGAVRYLGVFTDEREAAKAYNQAALQLFGEYARLNQI